jgi:thiol-disulfide isomerase/thioredoxin
MRITGIRVWLVVLLLGCSGVAGSEPRSASQEAVDTQGDAYKFLDGVLKRYATARTYHIEFSEETQLNSDVKRTWEKLDITGLILPDRRYRFEAQSSVGRAVQICDGISEWFYLPQIEQYTKEPAPVPIPGAVPKAEVPGLSLVHTAQRVLGRFSRARSLIRSASYLTDEKIQVNGRPVLCTVVRAQGLLPRVAGVPGRMTETFTYWIDKKEGTIWKVTAHQEGPIFPETPHTEYKLETTVWFKASEPNARTAPHELFVFKPTGAAELVKEFVSPRDKMVREPVGKPVPAVNLVAEDGKAISLNAFRGKPVLLDFWATWCAPCVESLPAVEKLYRETVGEGLVLVSIDDDEAAQTATEFLSKRKETWLNFHLTDAITDAFPAHGIPYFVLVDASGKVVYSHEGIDEAGLRAAVAELGPAFAGASRNSEP